MDEVQKAGEADNGGQVEVHLHQTLRVTLCEARTAGFRWYLRTPMDPAVSLVDDGVLPPPAERVGGTLVHHWDFRADKVGITPIVFDYMRTWERKSAPVRTFSLSVRVT